MALSKNAYTLLRVCGQAMVRGEAVKLDLFDALIKDFYDHRNRNEILSTLGNFVEEYSGQQRTVRAADSALFADQIQGPCLYLVTCPIETPKEFIKELSTDMRLYLLGPYDNGFEKTRPASRESVERDRAYALEVARRHEQRQKAEADIEKIQELANAKITKYIDRCMDREKVHDARKALPDGYWNTPTLEDIATACAALDISLSKILGIEEQKD